MISQSFEGIPTMAALEGLLPLVPEDIDAYCVKCKTSRKMLGAQLVTTKNGKTAAQGKCAVCRTTMMKFLPVRY
jgi:hypothetical protein